MKTPRRTRHALPAVAFIKFQFWYKKKPLREGPNEELFDCIYTITQKKRYFKA